MVNLIAGSMWIVLFIMNMFTVREMNESGELRSVLKYILVVLWLSFVVFMSLYNLIEYIRMG